MAAYDIQKHFKGLRVETGRRKGRRDPFATGFEDDSDEGKTRKSRPETKAPPVQKPLAPSKTSVASPFSAIDALRDSEDEFLDPPKRSDRQPSPAPTNAAFTRLIDGASTGRRGSLDKGLLPPSRNSRAAVALAAGDLAYLDDSSDEEPLSNRRGDRRPSPAPRKDSDSANPQGRSHTPRGDRAPLTEDSLNRAVPSRHTVASPFAGTKYLEDSESDSDDEAISSRSGSTDETAAPTDGLEELRTTDTGRKYLDVRRVDKPKQGGSGVSWRAFSVSRTEQRTAEIEALQASLKQRGKSISFGTHALTDDGKRVPIPAAPDKSCIDGRGRVNIRGKSPPRRSEDVKPTDDELRDDERTSTDDPARPNSDSVAEPPSRQRAVSDPNRGRDFQRTYNVANTLPDIRIDDFAHT